MLLRRLFGRPSARREEPRFAAPVPSPGRDVRAMATGDAGRLITTSQELEEYLRGQDTTTGLRAVAPNAAMQVTAVQTCLRLIGGGVANTPMSVKRVTAGGAKEDALGSETWNLLKRRPNRFMRPAQFFRMSIAHVLLRGNFYCLKVLGGNGHVRELLPIHPDRVEPIQDERTGEVTYRYAQPLTGRILDFPRERILHLYNLTFDGVKGVSRISFAANTVEGSIAMDQHAASLFKNGARVSGIFTTEKRLGPEGRQNVRAALDEYRSGNVYEGRELILEDGLTYEKLSLTAQDAQYIETRKLQKADIYEIFGIPLHMTALADRQSNWGTGVEQHNKQFIQWVLEDYFVMWEEAINIDLIAQDSPIIATFDRAKLTRGDLAARTAHHTAMLQWGVISPNEVRDDLDMNKREGGDVFYPPPNMTADEEDPETEDSEGDDE